MSQPIYVYDHLILFSVKVKSWLVKTKKKINSADS